jgi:hypothetical protein
MDGVTAHEQGCHSGNVCAMTVERSDSGLVALKERQGLIRWASRHNRAVRIVGETLVHAERLGGPQFW